MNDQKPGFRTGPIDRVRNRYSGKKYSINTARGINSDYWQTSILPVKFLIFVDFFHPVMSFIRNTEEDALSVHEQVKLMVDHIVESEWVKLSPGPLPKDGLSKGAREKLQ